MNVKIKKLHPDAVIPVYAKPGDSGFDLVATETVVIVPGETLMIPTGLAFEIPEGYELQVRPRSGVTSKTKLRVQLGTVDSGYRGEVKVIVDCIESSGTYGVRDSTGNLVKDYDTLKAIVVGDSFAHGSYMINAGTKIAQGVICPVQRVELIETDDLSGSERSTGGFGSTGY